MAEETRAERSRAQQSGSEHTRAHQNTPEQSKRKAPLPPPRPCPARARLTPQHFPPRQLDLPPPGVLLLLALHVPVDARILEDGVHTRRDVHERVPVPPARLEEQNRASVGRELVGKNATCRAGADDDVVVLLFRGRHSARRRASSWDDSPQQVADSFDRGERHLVSLFLCVVGACSSSVSSRERARHHRLRKGSDRTRKEGAVALWKAEHASGSTCKWCAFYLGGCYEDDLGGVEKDEARAVELYHEAADQRGNSVAMHYLGLIYKKGLLGVEVDEAKALNYYRSASDAGTAHASGHLALQHEDGLLGLDINLEEAARLFNIAKERDIRSTAHWTRCLVRANAKIAAKIAAKRQQQEEAKQGEK